MLANETITLDVWKGDWGLPSVNRECLQILAYARFCEIPLKINSVSNPFQTPHGKLPLLKCGKETLDKVEDIIQFFKERNYDPDSSLTTKECTEIIAYDNMLKEKLYPALQFIWWVDQKNLNEVIKPWYCNAIPFPLNFYYPGKFEREAKNMIETLYPMEDDLASLETQVYSKAQKCLTSLSTRLDDNKYFFGSQPSSLDAIVYAYLAPLLKTTLPNAALQNHLKACTNLVNFVSRISQRYFKDEHLRYERLRLEKSEEPAESALSEERKNQILAGLFAVCAMLGYAVLNGIVKVSQKGVETYYDDDRVKYIMVDEEEEN